MTKHSKFSLYLTIITMETCVSTRIIIIIIIKNGWQCKAGGEKLTPLQSKDPSPTIPTHRMKEEKGKTVGDSKQLGQ